MPSGSEIDVRYQDGHAGTTDEVARPQSDIAALPASKLLLGLELVAAGPKMAGKTSEPFSVSEPFGRRFRPYVRSLEPRARPDRSKWLHGSPAESAMMG